MKSRKGSKFPLALPKTQGQKEEISLEESIAEIDKRLRVLDVIHQSREKVQQRVTRFLQDKKNKRELQQEEEEERRKKQEEVIPRVSIIFSSQFFFAAGENSSGVTC